MTAPVTFSFEHAHILCTDIDATERWLVDVMGAEVTERRWSRDIPALTLTLYGLTIFVRGELSEESLGAPDHRQFGLDHFGLLVNDVDAAVELLRGRGAVIDTEPFDFMPGSRLAFVRGPDNVRVELTQRG
jgi:lactoylglutathione lyase